MALRTGYTPGEWRESYWLHDDAVDWDATPKDERAAYLNDGDASHLVLRSNGAGEPTTIRFRALTAEEIATIRGLVVDWRRGEAETDEEYGERVTGGINVDRLQYYAFRVGVEIPSLPDCAKVREQGVRMIPRRATNALVANYGQVFVSFYGGLVLAGSILGQHEKTAPRRDDEPAGVVATGDAK